MTRWFVLVLVAAVGWLTQAGAVWAAEPVGRYAVVVNKGVAAGPWGKVVKFLETKHKAKTFAYDKAPEDVRKDVGAYRPRYVCFVCPPTEDFPAFAAVANKFCRTLDDDPYVDAIWGILTGLDADHAMELATAEPVVIRRAFTKTLGPWLNWVPEGEYVTEWTRDRGELGAKKVGTDFAVKTGGPTSDADDAKLVHKLLAEDSFDLIIGSGHGGHNNWMLMYPSGKGFLTAKDGKLAMTASGVDLPLAGKRPKVYWAVGNCLTGVVNSGRNNFKDSYALAWMKNGTRQYVGAVQSTWYELNWNMADWFLKQEGRWTFSESLFLLRQWSHYLLTENVVTGRDREGTAFTDGIFVLYGDPALEARVEKTRDPALTETLDVRETGVKDVVRMTYTVTVNFVGEGNKRTAEKFGGWRIFCHLLPYQVTDVAIEKSDFAKVVCPGETLIWDAGKGLKVGDVRSVTFTAKRVPD
ncbi:hypothetical protein [Limnoglobus roseus]|uniref:Gingipain domain-containing protein n=1 Tax=Limnoglobus roseus TaxID=2598579 RepID=A0A5C1APE8_9BACT|nr:hypothetical protein [Limnoglobus roseus]QEL19622.1 hypothetical protein PX52LOC_06698 [Limnoglobus roseus]